MKGDYFMKLNQDCIRDILLFIESNDKDVVSVDELLVSLPYDKDTIIYHINEMKNLGLFEYITMNGSLN